MNDIFLMSGFPQQLSDDADLDPSDWDLRDERVARRDVVKAVVDAVVASFDEAPGADGAPVDGGEAGEGTDGGAGSGEVGSDFDTLIEAASGGLYDSVSALAQASVQGAESLDEALSALRVQLQELGFGGGTWYLGWAGDARPEAPSDAGEARSSGAESESGGETGGETGDEPEEDPGATLSQTAFKVAEEPAPESLLEQEAPPAGEEEGGATFAAFALAAEQPLVAAAEIEPISFGAAALQGELNDNPTALGFSQSGNPVLFVTQQDGKIYRYEIERQPDGPDADTTDEFVVTDSLLLNIIPQQIQNYNDDGSTNGTHTRQVTGMVVSKDVAGNDVLYVTSSDWRIAVGTDSGLDTNSSQIHRITLDADTGAVLENVAILRGLPRSEENHSVNGLDLSVDPSTGDVYLWVAVGGITNAGAPGNNFAGTAGFALSDTILKINLTTIESYDIRTDGQGDQFLLDLPTLDDPTRPNVNLGTLNIQNLGADPNFTLDDNGSVSDVLNPDWAGGNNGLNQAKITNYVLASVDGQLALVDNPVEVFAPGFRNPYDVLVLESGEVFTWDNGPNGGWGGQPLSYSDGQLVDDWTSEFATNEFSESGSVAFGDQLHYLGEITDPYGTYGGHANAIRAAAEGLAAAFNTDGTYKGASASDPIIAFGVEIFANEAEARDFLSKLLIIYEEQGDGNWVDVTGTTGLPTDFYDVVSGYDWSHPGSSLSNPLAFFNGTSVMDGTVFSPESQLLDDTVDGSLLVIGSSTNGLTEYLGTFFGGELQGAIVAASFNGTVYFVRPLDNDGDGRSDAAEIVHTISGFGSEPLAVTALSDQGLSEVLIDNNGDGIDDFAGLVVAATYGADNVTFFVPGGVPLDPGNDLDLDGLNNTVDSHVGDPLNGLGVIVGPFETAHWDFELNNPSSTPPGAVPDGDSIASGIGVNAAWRDGVLPQADNGGDPGAGLYDLGVFNLGGASSFVSIDRAFGGTAVGAANTQQDVVGIGFAAALSTTALTISTEMANIFTYSLNTDVPTKTWDGGEKVGLFVGPGDQSTFAEATIAVIDDGGTIRYGVMLVVEEGDVPVTEFVEIPGIEVPTILGVGDPNFQVAMDVNLIFGAESVLAKARYVENGVYTDWVETSALSLPQAVVDAIRGQYNNLGAQTGAVAGMVSSAAAGDDSFAASWDWIDVASTDGGSEVIYRWNAGTSTVAAIDGGPDWVADTSVLVGGPTFTSTQNVSTLASGTPPTTPTGIFAQERWDPGTDAEMQFEFALDPGTYAIRLYMADGYFMTNDPGERVFDVSIEGALFLDDFDLNAVLGHGVGGMFEWVGNIDDGFADIDFAHVVENPLINGIEIIALGTGPSGPVISVADASVGESAGSVNVAISASTAVPAGESVSVSYEIRPLSGGATPEVDYTVAGATYNAGSGIYTASGNIGAGASQLLVPITILGDSIDEPDEAFQLVITGVSGAGAAIGDGNANVTILDDDAPAVVGEVRFGINEASDNIQISNYNAGSFVLENTGDKVVTSVTIDATGALYPDAVFDPFGLAGDTISKGITIDSSGGTGVIAPSGSSYIGAGGAAGYHAIQLSFDQAVNSGFQPGEIVTFSVDMDPNSIAGSDKDILDSGTNPFWDVGGVSGAELIGASFTVTYADGSTSTGELIGLDNQGGSVGLSSQAATGQTATLTVNGLGEGGVGTYDAGGPSVVVSGPAGATVRVVLTKGFIQPVANEFYNGDVDDQAYAPQLDAQLAALAGEDFPANNAVEFQTVDVPLTGGAQDISGMFDFSGVADFTFAGEDQLPIGFVAAVIDPGSDLPVGPVTDAIYLTYDSSDTFDFVYRWNAGGSNVAATDGGPDWIADGSAVVAGSKFTTGVSSTIDTLDDSAPAATPLGIYAQETWDQAGGDEMQIEFDLDPGTYAIRLYMGNFYSGTNDPGERVFDVSIEGLLAFDDVDLVSMFGHGVGGMLEWTGTVTDGTADIDFAHVVENPLINAIEIIQIDDLV